MGRSDDDAGLVGDSVSNLDYSGGRKTHRFPPPYGLGSLSLTHCPTENPTGVTIELIPCGKLPIQTFPNQGKEHSVGFLSTWEGGARYPPQLGEGQGGEQLLLCHSGLRPGIA